MENKNLILAFVPSTTIYWTRDDYTGMISDSLRAIKSAVEHGSYLNFNCGKFNFEDWEAGGGNTWGSKLMELMLENTVTQWIQEETTVRRGRCTLEIRPLIWSRKSNLLTKQLAAVQQAQMIMSGLKYT